MGLFAPRCGMMLVVLTSAVASAVYTPAAHAEFWDQQACIAEGNTADVCSCTKKMLDDGLAAKFKPELIKAFDERGMAGLDGTVTFQDQMALAKVIIDTMTVNAPASCKYKDDPNVN